MLICQKNNGTDSQPLNKSIDAEEIYVSDREYPQYVIDDDTQQLLESCMNLAQRVIDLQEDDETAESMQYELEELAERFNIQRGRVVTSQTTREDGSIDLNIKIEPENSPPKLTVIEGNKEDPKIVPIKPTDPTKP